MTSDIITLNVAGMTCGGCARSVERSVQATPGVLEASVDLPTRTLKARVDPARADARALREAVERAGYEVA
jgi:copper chaperone CopZ